MKDKLKINARSLATKNLPTKKRVFLGNSVCPTQFFMSQQKIRIIDELTAQPVLFSTHNNISYANTYYYRYIISDENQ